MGVIVRKFFKFFIEMRERVEEKNENSKRENILCREGDR